MGIFTAKSPVMTEYAMIGELDNLGDMHWCIADYDYCWKGYIEGILVIRGYRTINDITYSLFFLPPIPTKTNTI